MNSFNAKPLFSVGDRVRHTRFRIQGEITSGAKVQLDIDLKERGIAWRPDNEALPMFDATVREIEDRFKTL